METIHMTKENIVEVACKTRYTVPELENLLALYKRRGRDFVKVPLPSPASVKRMTGI
jgi:hypothetical protein